MKLVMMMLGVLSLGGCGVMKHVAGTDQCMAPTAREAKITKKVWM